MKKFSTLLVITLVISNLLKPAFAQFPGMGGTTQPKALPGTAGDQTPKGNAKITGYVIDSAATKAVEFASIALYNKTDGKAVNGTMADEKGKFILIAVEKDGKSRAEKRYVVTGLSYNGKIQIKSGLNAGEKIISMGYQTVTDGQLLTL